MYRTGRIEPRTRKALFRCDNAEVRWSDLKVGATFGSLSSVPRERHGVLDAGGRTANGWTIVRISDATESASLSGQADPKGIDLHERYIARISVNRKQKIVGCVPAHSYPSCSLTLDCGILRAVHEQLRDGETICFAMPRQFVDQRLAMAEEICGRLIDVRSGLGRVVEHCLEALQVHATEMSDAEFAKAAQVVGELVVAVLGNHRGDNTDGRPMRTRNLARVKRAIRARLADPELQLSEIAEECGLSLSYMHNLFRDDGNTAWQYLKSQRLQCARTLLDISDEQPMTVTEAAMACGFSNMSQFSTAFRRAFSVSPREVLRRRERLGRATI